MPQFTIFPTDLSAPTRIVAANAESVLHTMSRLHCDRADVVRDGAYAFSIQIGEGGFWTIYQRDEPIVEFEAHG